MQTHELVQHLDELLNIRDIQDVGFNGLQVDNGNQTVTKVAFAVDACMESFQQTVNAGAQILVVHHGLMWGKLGPITGMTYDRIRLLIERQVALYGVHLPLDLHHEFGHNAQIATLLGLQEVERFGEFRGQPVGFMGRLPKPIYFKDFCQMYEEVNRGPITALPFGKETVETVAVISGDAALSCFEAMERNIDVFITGESNYIAYHPAREGKLNLIFGGHYHTEKFGLFALATHLETEFNLETVFFDIPTGF